MNRNKVAREPESTRRSVGERRVLFALFVLSGAAALVYQVLWVRELGLLFGSTAQGAALTIAVFFTGIAGGGWFWGQRTTRRTSALRTFGRLELGVAVTALGYFVLVDAYGALYPHMYAAIGHVAVLDTLLKIAIAASVLLPASFLMGGTLPVLASHIIDDGERLGQQGAVLYAVNTAGAALGALAAGFVLPLALGVTGTYLLAVGVDAAVGLSALALAAKARVAPPATNATAPMATSPSPAARGAERTLRRSTSSIATPLVWAIAIISGIATLGLEVIWTRLFAQVLQNSASTYALVLATFLVALALGALLAHGLSRLHRPSPALLLGVLLTAGALVTAVAPDLFVRATGGLRYIGGSGGWGAYTREVAGLAALVMLLPVTVLGGVLPFLLRILQSRGLAVGVAVGRVVAANTAGAIAGALVTGFVLLPWLGSWASMRLFAGVYLAMALAVLASQREAIRVIAVSVGVAGTIGLVSLAGVRYDLVSLDERRGEELVEIREGAHATAAVVARGEDRLLRVNNYYTLGGSSARHTERDQTVIPLLTHSHPRSVFYLGMGTGLTAGAALPFEVEHVEVCEILPEVVALAQRHFDPWIFGLFDDPRVVVHADDGRVCLARQQQRYDMIISDLFTPWKAGTGNLYTAEHFAVVRERLEPGGLFVQWLPLYQLSDVELGVIARTMDEAFEQVVAWRGDLFSSRSIIALVGQAHPAPLDLDDAFTNAAQATDIPRDELEEKLLAHYLGNISSSGVFADRPVNTDARPLIEHLAPRTHRAVRSGDASFVVGAERERFYEQLAVATPASDDPYLALLDDRQLALVDAGRVLSAYRHADAAGQDDQAHRLLAELRELTAMPASAQRSPAARLLGEG